MKRYFNYYFLFFVNILLVFPTISSAQFPAEQLKLNDANQSHVIVLKFGMRIKGSITSIKNEKVWIQSTKQDSLFQLTLSEIKRIRIKDNFIHLPKKFYSRFPPNLKLFFTNTAFAMKKGEKSYQTNWGNSIIFTSQSSETVELGIGTSFPFFVNAKFKVTSGPKEKNRRHGGQIAVAFAPLPDVGRDDVGLVLEVSQMNTWGTPDRFFNLTFNYYENTVDGDFGFNENRVFLPRYASVALGGGFRVTENLQIIANKNINFSSTLIDFNLLPSFAVNWRVKHHLIGFGFNSNNNFGFNFYPIFDTDFDEFILMEKGFFSKLPYFSYSRIFKKGKK